MGAREIKWLDSTDVRIEKRPRLGVVDVRRAHGAKEKTTTTTKKKKKEKKKTTTT